jgi:hypothetical protein
MLLEAFSSAAHRIFHSSRQRGVESINLGVLRLYVKPNRTQFLIKP